MEQLKKGVVTVTVLPPEITQSFSRSLLEFERWITREILSKTYWELAKGKYKPDSRKMRELDEHLEIYGKLYEWQKAQEAYDKAEKKEAMERPVVPTEAIYRLRGQLGKNVRDAFASARFIQGDALWKKH